MTTFATDTDLQAFIIAAVSHADRMAARACCPYFVTVSTDGSVSVAKTPGKGCSVEITEFEDDREHKIMQLTIALMTPPAATYDYTLNANERALVESGKWIESIKAYRTRVQTDTSGTVGLKEAKDLTEAYRISLGWNHPANVDKRERDAESARQFGKSW